MLREQIQGLRAAQDMAADIAAFDVKYQYRAATAPVDVTYGSYVRFPAMLLFDDSFDSIVGESTQCLCTTALVNTAPP